MISSSLLQDLQSCLLEVSPSNHILKGPFPTFHRLTIKFKTAGSNEPRKNFEPCAMRRNLLLLDLRLFNCKLDLSVEWIYVIKCTNLA